jgi:hypothetical protein
MRILVAEDDAILADGPTLIKHGVLTKDQVGRVAQMNGDAIELSAREVSLLEIFLQRARWRAHRHRAGPGLQPREVPRLI